MSDRVGGNRFVTPLSGVPDVESPFFERLFVEKNLSADVMRIASDLNRNGYAVFDFPDPEFGKRSEEVIQALQAQFDFDDWQRTGWRAGSSLRLQDAWETNHNVRAIAANARVLEILSALYGRKAFPFQTLNFPVGTQQALHSDSVHFSSVPERFMCGVWVALEDIDDANGPLEYYAGSHKLPIYLNEHIAACAAEQAAPDMHYPQYLKLWRELMEVHRFPRETFRARKGQALVWAANLLHGGSHQVDPTRTRWSQVTHYYFEGCAYYTPLMSDPAYGAMYYREPTNIGSGERVPNTYAGRPVKSDVIERATPSFLRPVRAAPDNTLPPDFDPVAYLASNPDVAAANIDPAAHWQQHGWREGRRFR